MRRRTRTRREWSLILGFRLSSIRFTRWVVECFIRMGVSGNDEYKERYELL